MGAKFQSLKRQFYRQQVLGIVVIVLIAGIGTYFLVVSHAATPYASTEAENGTLGGGATTVSDNSASGNSSVKFGSGTISNSSCNFLTVTNDTPAFCDDFSEGPSSGGRAGALDPTKWSVSRLVGAPQPSSPSTDFMPFPSTPVSACKAGITSVNPDNDILVCDSASGHQGQILTANSAQWYAELAMRPRQPFDFAGRTGTISYNVDAITEGNLSWWTSLFVSDQPTAGANLSTNVTGLMPRNGVGISFDNCGVNGCPAPCNGGAAPLNGFATTPASGVETAYQYKNYVETQIPNSSPTCIQTQRGSLNHIEVRLSQTNIQVWASDFSPDGGKTFPNFRQIFSAPISLSFSRGYVYFVQGERAPTKYSGQPDDQPDCSGRCFGINPQYANNYWSDLGFDGPVINTGEVGYSVPDSLTPDSAQNGAPNVGYPLNSSEQSPANTFTVPNVKLQGVTAADLSFAVQYNYAFGLTTANAALHYRINSGPWREASPEPNYAAEETCTTCPGNPIGGGGVPFSFAIPLTDLTTGTDTISLEVDNAPDSYPPILTSLDLLTFTGNAPPP